MITVSKGTLAKVEITVGGDAQLDVKYWPHENAAVHLLVLALDALGYEASLIKRTDGDTSSAVVLTDVQDADFASLGEPAVG
jgi:hypothetical protein